ncbi:MAG: Glu/Leu/Phe/Val dehydrogenase [Nitrospinae bacterium]|nr:Glu/Leu/Phe/Val dehydrogenase [Nitrospinota bacterium]
MTISLKLPKKLTIEILDAGKPEGRFSETDDNGPEQIVRVLDPENVRSWGYVVVDNTRRGPGLGGIRLADDISVDEVKRLARAMTLKNSASCLPFGGGKSGLAADPRVLKSDPALKADLVALFAEALFPLTQYVPAPDMGIDENDVQLIHDVFSRLRQPGMQRRSAAGRPVQNGGIPIDQWGLTAHGLMAAAVALESRFPDFRIKNARTVIQGYGSVGSWTAVKLHAAGATIAGASDINAALWNPSGLDVEALNRVRTLPGGLSNYTGKTEKRFSPSRLDWLLEAPCDLLVPSARPDAITSRNADRVQCRFILQGANNPSNKMTEYYLEKRRNILSLADFIVNAGGVIGCAVELKMDLEKEYRSKVLAVGPRPYLENLIHDTVSRNIFEIFDRLSKNKTGDTIFREEALRLAKERLLSPRSDYWM